MEAMHEQVEQEERQWELDVLQHIKREEQQLHAVSPANADDDELLFYEVVT